MKYYFGKLLGARVFQGQDAVKEVEEEIKQTTVYKRNVKKMQAIMKLSTPHLQQFVRSSWLKTPPASASSAEARFLSTVIKPALDINVTSVPGCFQDVISRFSRWLSRSDLDEAEAAQIRVAAGVLGGRLDGHPLIHGLALQCLRQVEKAERGVTSMRGRRSKETSAETQLIYDAGLTLATASGFNSLVKMLLHSITRIIGSSSL